MASMMLVSPSGTENTPLRTWTATELSGWLPDMLVPSLLHKESPAASTMTSLKNPVPSKGSSSTNMLP